MSWLRSEAKEQDRSVTWIVNKMFEQARKERDEQHAKQA